METIDAPQATAPQARLLALRKFPVRTALILASAVLILVLAELGLRLYNRFPIVERYFTPSANLAGYALAPSVRYEYLHDGRHVVVSTDATGHRVVPSAPTTAQYELYVIGDSQVFGWALNDDETLPECLQQTLGPSWKVLNLGVPGYSPFQYAEALEKVPANALALVIQTEANDFQDAYAKRPPIQARCGYLMSTTPLGQSMPCFLLGSELFAKIAEWRVRSGAKLPVPIGYNPYVRVAGRVLRYRIDTLYANSARPRRTLYASIPWDAAMSSQRLASYTPKLDRATRVLALPDDCYLDQAFRRDPNPDALFRQMDSHLSPSGARLAAATIAQKIRDAMQQGSIRLP